MSLARIGGRMLVFVGLWLLVEKWCGAFRACSSGEAAAGFLAPGVGLAGVLLTLPLRDRKPSVPAIFGAAFWSCLTGYVPSALVVGILSFIYLRCSPDPTGEIEGMLLIGAFYLPVFALPALAGYGVLIARDDDEGIVSRRPPPMTPSTAREEDEDGGEKAGSDSDEKQ